MSLLKQLQSKWSEGAATVATIATVDLLQKQSVAKVATVASFKDEGTTQTRRLIVFDPTNDGDPLLEELLDLGNQICNYWGDSEAARDQMRLDILSYSPHQREDLMATLKGSLRANKPRGSHEDDRVMCIECKHLHGPVCRNWKQAGVAQKADGATLPSNFTVLLQRCDGFKSAIAMA